MADEQQLLDQLTEARKRGDEETAVRIAQQIAAARAGEPTEGFERGDVLPLQRDRATGEVSLAVPRMAEAAYDTAVGAVKFFGDAAYGRTPMFDAAGHFSDEAIGRSADAAMMFGPASPAAGTRALPRPVPTGRDRIAAAMSRQGVDLPIPIASDNRLVQEAGSRLSQVPFVGAPLQSAAGRAVGQIDDAMTRAGSMGAGNPQVAGSRIASSIRSRISPGGAMDDALGQAYGRVDARITNPGAKVPLSATQKVANTVSGERLEAAMPDSGAVKIVSKALKRKEGLGYHGVKRLRTDVGERLDPASKAVVPQGMSTGELKQVYGGLSDDLRRAARAGGGRPARREFNAANAMAKKFADERNVLTKVIGKTEGQLSDEQIYQRLKSMASAKGGANIKTLRAAKAAVSDDAWKELQSAVVSEIGRGPDGNWSPLRFVTEYGKLSPAGKGTLFGGRGTGGIRQSLDDILEISQKFKELEAYRNTSKTAAQGAFIAAGVGSFYDLLTTAGVAATSYGLSHLLARPATARATADLSRTYLNFAENPTRAAYSVLYQSANRLSLAVAKEADSPEAADDVRDQIMSGVPLPYNPDTDA